MIANWINLGRTVLQTEAQAILQVAERLDSEFDRAVDLILSHNGKTILTGVGKSGHIAQKIAASLSSLGTPAVFLHAADATHGDLGICSPGDPVILFSKSGSTAEVIKLLPLFRDMGCPMIAIVGNKNSTLARGVDIVLDVTVSTEADPNNLAPTTSTTVALAIGDALACTLSSARGFTPDDFARFHPGGQLGRNLTTRVSDAAHKGDKIAWIKPDMPIKEVVIEMTRYPLGAACVVDSDHHLLGLITDGDLRRALTNHDDIRLLSATDIMTPKPTTISVTALCRDALELMENRPSQISVLPVLDGDICTGLIRIHDIYSEK